MRRLQALTGLPLALVSAPTLTVSALAGLEWAAPLAFLAWLLVAACVIRAPKLWAWPRSRAEIFLAFCVAFAFLVLTWFGSWGFWIDHRLCGETSYVWVAWAVAGCVYFPLAAFGLSARKRLWAWPLGIVLGMLVYTAMLFVVPGARGFCET